MVPPDGSGASGSGGGGSSGQDTSTVLYQRPVVTRQDSDAGGAKKRGAIQVEMHPSDAASAASRSPWVQELVTMLHLAWPVSAATIFRLVLNVTDTAFLGRLGSDELAASSLAGVVYYVMSCFPYGAAVALNSLCSQAYGSENYFLLGSWLQISLVLCTVFAIPAMIPLFFTDKILSLVIDNPHVCHLAGIYASINAARLLPTLWYCALRQYFQVQGVVMPATIVSLLSVVVNIGLNQLLIHGIPSTGWHGLGFVGSPLATLLSVLFQLGVFVMYAIVWKKLHLKTWAGWNKASFTGKRLKTFTAISLPIGMYMFLDEAVYQFVTLLAGKLGSVETSGQGILMSLWAIVWAAWWGVGLASQIRVGHHLGAGDVPLAKRSARVGFCLSVAVASTLAGSIVLAREKIAAPFTSDPLVIESVADNTVYFAAAFFASTIGLFFGAILEGMARPGVMALLSAVTGWGVTLPTAYLYTDKLHQGVRGLWLGPCSGETLKALLAAAVVACTNWEAMSKKAQKRSEKPGCDDDDDGDSLEREPLLAAELGRGGGSCQALSLQSSDSPGPT
eukprot:m.238809 g.238809  ORF g.238809 m.238809 type:complete len:562 (+) comp18971_c1_seq1:427-2112(+)